MLRIATFNVNGIRAAAGRGFGAWLQGRDCDVVALQEVRCPAESLPDGIFGDFHVAYDPGTIAGRNGVALLTRQEPDDVRLGIGSGDFAHEGRYIEVDLDGLAVGSLYLPAGSEPWVDQAKYERKMLFMDALATHLIRASHEALRCGREFLVVGDFNIAHTRFDLRNWQSNQKNKGFLPEERAWFGSIVSPDTLVDVVRGLHPQVDGPYSWWSWRGQAFVKDVGWRIDYHVATPTLAARAVSGGTDRPESYEARISDHAPVVVDYDL